MELINKSHPMVKKALEDQTFREKISRQNSCTYYMGGRAGSVWLVGSGVSAPVRVDLVKASTDARRGLPVVLLVVLGEVASIGR